MKSASSAASAAAQMAASSASGRAKAMLARMLSLNRATSCGTRATAARKEACVTDRASRPSISTRPSCGSSRRRASLTMVDLPAPDGPTRAVVVPAGVTKLTSSSPAARASCRKPTWSNTISAPHAPAGRGKATASGASATCGACRVTFNISSMSMKDWRISR
ncbi:hypothetical protein D3C80_1056970 [compost metagenome]